MSVYLGKDRKHATGTMAATHESVIGSKIIDMNCTWTISFFPLTYLTMYIV
jgi:hypothetical protein